jgi:K+-transporting ATPase ATPase C chain
MTSKNRKISSWRPIVGLAVLSLLMCGLFFPLLITALAQAFFPYQAGGEIVQLNGKLIGSNLIAQNFTLPIFFHQRPKNESASGVDPDITLQDAYSQIPQISNAILARAHALNVTNITLDSLQDSLKAIINQNEEGVFWIFGSPYVNVLKINLALINAYPLIYSGFPSTEP